MNLWGEWLVFVHIGGGGGVIVVISAVPVVVAFNDVKCQPLRFSLSG